MYSVPMMASVKWKDIVEAAAQDDIDAVKYFVEEEYVPATTCNLDGRTAAHVALQNGNLALLKYLVNADPSVLGTHDKHGRSILIQAVDQGALDAIKFLLEEHDENVAYKHNLWQGNTAVHVAALRGQLDVLKYLLDDRGIDVNVRNDAGETPLFQAAQTAHMPVVKYLVEVKKAKIHVTDKDYNNVLYVSAETGDLIVPRYLLDDQRRKINLNFRNGLGETVLHRAVQFGHLHFVQYLVEEKGVCVNIVDDDGRTALHHAALNGNLAVVKYLCDCGAFQNAKDEHNQTAVEVATDPEVVKYLKAVSPKPNQRRRIRGYSTSKELCTCVFMGWKIFGIYNKNPLY